MPVLIRLEPWTEADLDLLHRFNAPEMTAHLGGPETDAQVRARHARYLEAARTGDFQVFRVVLPAENAVAGGVLYWDRVWQDQPVYEMGWSVLPEFHGRGIATAAAAAAARLAAAEHRHRYL